MEQRVEMINLALVMWNKSYREVFEATLTESGIFNFVYSNSKANISRLKTIPDNSIVIVDEYIKKQKRYSSTLPVIERISIELPLLKIVCMTIDETTDSHKKGIMNYGAKAFLYKLMNIEVMKAEIMILGGMNPVHPGNPLYIASEAQLIAKN